MPSSRRAKNPDVAASVPPPPPPLLLVIATAAPADAAASPSATRQPGRHLIESMRSRTHTLRVPTVVPAPPPPPAPAAAADTIARDAPLAPLLRREFEDGSEVPRPSWPVGPLVFGGAPPRPCRADCARTILALPAPPLPCVVVLEVAAEDMLLLLPVARRGGLRRDPFTRQLFGPFLLLLPRSTAAVAAFARAKVGDLERAVAARAGEWAAATSGEAGAVGEPRPPPPRSVMDRAEAGEDEEACADTDAIEPGVLGALTADGSGRSEDECRGGVDVDMESVATDGAARCSSSARHRRSRGTLFCWHSRNGKAGKGTAELRQGAKQNIKEETGDAGGVCN